MAAAGDSPNEAEAAACVQRRMTGLTDAQVHAALALLAIGLSAQPDHADTEAWREVAVTALVP